MQTAEYFRRARWLLKQAQLELRGASVQLKFHHLERSLLEGVLARGDRQMSRVIEAAYRLMDYSRLTAGKP